MILFLNKKFANLSTAELNDRIGVDQNRITARRAGDETYTSTINLLNRLSFPYILNDLLL